MELKNKDILLELLHDADDFAFLKKIKCPPIYILGGSGCILGDYLTRATLDIDFIDINYDASVGKIFRLFDRFDMLDTYVTPISTDFEKRSKFIDGFSYLKFYILSREDIIVSKLARYSIKDKEDIKELIKEADYKILNELIQNVINRKDFSKRIQMEFKKNSLKFKEKFNV
ncbi:DUF6036 family nucleotidyltransferase [Helicovermis profundi]|uniref:DUF6036 domain-containing protein n=1 Tax=Helicovermis profundi TaxID=3065157 RepID=A0AAU9E4K6_9FIRM|nr:hypothetical protein HLPR_18750 [Clostridia bacterium S502]